MYMNKCRHGGGGSRRESLCTKRVIQYQLFKFMHAIHFLDGMKPTFTWAMPNKCRTVALIT